MNTFERFGNITMKLFFIYVLLFIERNIEYCFKACYLNINHDFGLAGGQGSAALVPFAQGLDGQAERSHSGSLLIAGAGSTGGEVYPTTGSEGRAPGGNRGLNTAGDGRC